MSTIFSVLKRENFKKYVVEEIKHWDYLEERWQIKSEQRAVEERSEQLKAVAEASTLLFGK